MHLVIPFVEIGQDKETLDLVREFFSLGANGVFLVNNSVPCEDLLLLYRDIRSLYPEKWIGLSLKDVLAHEIFEIFPPDVDAYWIDDLQVIQGQMEGKDVDNILDLKMSKRWDGTVMGQIKISIYDDEKDFNFSMRIAKNFVDVVVLKSINSLSKTKQFLNSIRSSVNPRDLGMSFSDIDNTNIKHYLPHVRYLLFFDGVEGYRTIDVQRFASLVSMVRRFENDYTHFR